MEEQIILHTDPRLIIQLPDSMGNAEYLWPSFQNVHLATTEEYTSDGVLLSAMGVEGG